jgi:DNA-damage-inducible protein J
MAQTAVNIRMDANLKKNLEKTCKELGMNVTTAFTIFAKKVVREQRIPFEVTVDKFYSESNMRELDRRIEEMENGTAKVVVKTMEELEAMENE